MFKHILPQEAQVKQRHHLQLDAHLQSSAFKPLAIAMFTSVSKLKNSLSTRLRKKSIT